MMEYFCSFLPKLTFYRNVTINFEVSRGIIYILYFEITVKIVSEITSTFASLSTVFSLRHFISAPDSSCVLSAVAYFMFVLVSCQYNSVKMPRGRHDEVLIFISLCVSFSIWKDNSESCLFESRVYSRWDRKQVRVRMAVPETHIV